MSDANPQVLMDDLEFRRFSCCGCEAPYPFKCPDCGRIMVFCYECDSLHGDLSRPDHCDYPVNHFDTNEPNFAARNAGMHSNIFS
jgi:hypothetical protein